MLPKDLLESLETGDRTDEMIEGMAKKSLLPDKPSARSDGHNPDLAGSMNVYDAVEMYRRRMIQDLSRQQQMAGLANSTAGTILGGLSYR